MTRISRAIIESEKEILHPPIFSSKELSSRASGTEALAEATGEGSLTHILSVKKAPLSSPGGIRDLPRTL
jgi:hypothetical protein